MRRKVADSAPVQKNPRDAKLDVLQHISGRTTDHNTSGRRTTARGVHTKVQHRNLLPPSLPLHPPTQAPIMESTQGHDSRDHNIKETKSQDCARKIAALPANTAFIRTPDVLTLMILPAELRVKVRSNFLSFPVLTTPCFVQNEDQGYLA